MTTRAARKPPLKALPPPRTRLFGMQIPADLDATLGETARRHNLTKSGIARLALARGLAILNEQLQSDEP